MNGAKVDVETQRTSDLLAGLQAAGLLLPRSLVRTPIPTSSGLQQAVWIEAIEMRLDTTGDGFSHIMDNFALWEAGISPQRFEELQARRAVAKPRLPNQDWMIGMWQAFERAVDAERERRRHSEGIEAPPDS